MFFECWDSFTELNVFGEAIPNKWVRSRKSAASEFSTCSWDNKSRCIGQLQGTCVDVSVQQRI